MMAERRLPSQPQPCNRRGAPQPAGSCADGLVIIIKPAARVAGHRAQRARVLRPPGCPSLLGIKGTKQQDKASHTLDV